MTDIEKLLIARIQVDNLQELLKGNEYYHHMNLVLLKSITNWSAKLTIMEKEKVLHRAEFATSGWAAQ